MKYENRLILSKSIDEKYGFVFKKCDVPKISLAYWLSRPEFQTEIDKYISQSKTINDETIFIIMKKIYISKSENRKDNEDFNFSLARRSLVILSEKLFNDREAWKH